MRSLRTSGRFLITWWEFHCIECKYKKDKRERRERPIRGWVKLKLTMKSVGFQRWEFRRLLTT